MSREIIERALAGMALVALLPLLALCGLAIFVEDRRPILFRHRRIGLHGRPFLLLKLRSMRAASKGRSITAGNDARITTIGRFLRDHKIDELPQLWNVFRGDMNLVGPRPEVPEYVDLNDPRWQAVLSVKPGITDLASLAFRHEERLLARQQDADSFYRDWLLPRKLALSAHYARMRSLSTDARLIGLTLRHITGRGELNPHEIARQFAYRGNL